MLTGAVLLVIGILELLMVPFHPVMHPLLIAVSVALVAVPSTPSARAALRDGGPDDAWPRREGERLSTIPE